jgi:large subunit ribosomal protein L9
LELPGQIKTTGSHNVQVKLHPEVTATFDVNVVAAK